MISVVCLVSVSFVVDAPSVEPYMYEMFQKHGDVHIKFMLQRVFFNAAHPTILKMMQTRVFHGLSVAFSS